MTPLLFVASYTLYTANVGTFGCSSLDEVIKLRQLRSNHENFDKELTSQAFLGQCVEVPKGTLVEGSVEQTDPPTLLIDRKVVPPGYIALLSDFEEQSPKSDAP